MVAIVPAAGRGTRMRAVTGGLPKELVLLGSKPVLLRILEEARAADPDEIVVITSPEKTDIVNAVNEWARHSLADIPLRIAYQTEPTGAAPAVAAAEAKDDAVILFGDCVFAPETPVGRLANLARRGIDILVSVEQVPDEEVRRYGIVELDETTGSVYTIKEKPKLEETASRWAIAARFAFTKAAMDFLADYCAHETSHPRSEIPVPEVMNAAIAQGIEVRAVPLTADQRRVDCGSPEEYREAILQRWD